MSNDVPDWVRADCRTWGRQKRRIWRGADWHIKMSLTQEGTLKSSKHWHIDGFAESFMGRLLEEKTAASQGTHFNQHWPEVMWGNALDVQRAVIGMPESPYDVLHLHYVFDPEFGLTVRRKASLLQMSERAYWTALDRAEFWVLAKLQPSQVRSDDVVVPKPTMRKASRVIDKIALDFSSLGRYPLKLKNSAQN